MITHIILFITGLIVGFIINEVLNAPVKDWYRITNSLNKLQQENTQLQKKLNKIEKYIREKRLVYDKCVFDLMFDYILETIKEEEV